MVGFHFIPIRMTKNKIIPNVEEWGNRDLYTRVRRTNTLESKTGNGQNLVILLPGIYPAYRHSHT